MSIIRSCHGYGLQSVTITPHRGDTTNVIYAHLHSRTREQPPWDKRDIFYTAYPRHDRR